MKITLDHLRAAARRPINEANARSVLVALDRHGARFGLDQPHRATQLLAQLLHESAEFRHDREIWGPTPAQERYDVRPDLGNTPERDGDGKRYMGRTGMQITGKANYAAFRDWCRANVDPAAPDFVAHPEAVNTDPWEGLGPLWYWSTRKLNRYADAGDVETITKRINGGLNGFADRLDYLARVSLVLLGYGPEEVRAFQRKAQAQGLLPKDEPGKPSQVDGDAGPKTRAALHRALLALTDGDARSAEVKAAPVVEEVPVAPPALDRPVTQTGGFWERIGTIAFGGVGSAAAAIFGDWKVAAVTCGGVVIIALIGLIFHARIIAAVKAIKAASATP